MISEITKSRSSSDVKTDEDEPRLMSDGRDKLNYSTSTAVRSPHHHVLITKCGALQIQL